MWFYCSLWSGSTFYAVYIYYYFLVPLRSPDMILSFQRAVVYFIPWMFGVPCNSELLNLLSTTFAFMYLCIVWIISLFCRCIPFRYRTNNDETSDDEHKKLVEVLMINSQSGPGLLFPKVLYFKHLDLKYPCNN